MAAKEVFEFNDYKTYILHVEQLKGPHIRGFRTRLAEAATCNNTFISQVLNTSAHFSLEQGLAVSQYLQHSPKQEKYFLLLIEHARASTPPLKTYFQNELIREKEAHLNIKERVREDLSLSIEAQAIYFSQWYYAAVHMVVTIPHYRSIAAISKKLKISSAQVQKILDFLIEKKLVVTKANEYHPGPSYLHLEKKSPLIARHHSNWRLAAMESLANEHSQDIHYSAVSTLSQKDCDSLRLKVTSWIEEYVKDVSSSKEETICVFNLDFFKLGE